MNNALRRPADEWLVRLFLAALAVLLVGYMFMGRGFAHLGIYPVYVGELVLALGLVATAWALLRTGPARRPSPLVWLLCAFMLLGAIRTIPYVGVYGTDALRDAVLWGYAFFALFVYLLVDRLVLRRGMEVYAWIVPVFAIWLPISWTLFGVLSADIDPARPGEVVPLIFFKSGDMAVHIAGVIGFLTLGPNIGPLAHRFVWRMLAVVPLGWTALVGFATNRGSLVALAIAGFLALILGWRWRTWAPVFAGGLLALAIFALPSVPAPVAEAPSNAPSETISGGNATPSETAGPTAAPATPAPSVGPGPTDPPGRQIGLVQVIENLFSIFGPSNDPGLSGTRAFRLAWWSEIIDYTVFGPYFWDGKGFGVNLATADGFQPTADQSLRAPHNSHMTVLARMGVPGFALWLALQGAFAVLLLRATLSHRREANTLFAAAGAWILVYWTAMMVNTSFDPYLEGPQGGIWFWSLFGVGMVVIHLRPARSSP